MRNLAVFDLMNGARIIGETVAGFEPFNVLRPMVLAVEKGAEDGQIKIGLNRVLFTGDGSLYRLQPTNVLASFQCFDATIHNLYERTLRGESAPSPEAE